MSVVTSVLIGNISGSNVNCTWEMNRELRNTYLVVVYRARFVSMLLVV